MKTRNLFLIGLLLASPTSNSLAKCESLDSLEWLNHRWISKAEKNISVESWVKVSDMSFEGVGQVIDPNTGEIGFTESLRILQMSGEVFYLAKVNENPFPVAFKLIECSQQMAIFENPEHDFPQKLEYRRQSESALKVTVSGQGGRSFDVLYTQQDD